MVTNNKIQIINNKRIMINQVEVQILKNQIKELNPVAILKSHHSILILNLKITKIKIKNHRILPSIIAHQILHRSNIYQCILAKYLLIKKV
jgi:SMC interacting uncharacterized protein involved in chromosome segregation